MINLASFRYRNVFSDEGGPIERVETGDILLEGRRVFQANAFLKTGLSPVRKKRSVYSEASGSGTHASPLIARFMAISESLERWAYASKALSPERGAYGFDVDPMSNGMAAFPGLFARQARRSAYLEAVERFNLIAWWEGMLPGVVRSTPWPDIQAVVLGTDPDAVTVVVHKRSGEGHYAYGHAAAPNFDTACSKAVVELARHECVIRNYRLSRSFGSAVVAPPTELLERRSVFFACEEGRELFLRRLGSPPGHPRPPRRPAFDGVIPGPWSRYADVWRVVFHPVSNRYLMDDDSFFLW